jgi:superfamily II DNA/RNA helicase
LTSFLNFGLDAKILQVLKEIGFQNPTPIQELTIPKVLEGVDIIASAQTGTGKTAAFMLPILHLLSKPDYRTPSKGPLVLVLVPTRELAMQVAEETKKFSKYLSKTKTVCIYGGVPYPLQRKALACKYEILVATPGRLMDHMSQGRIDLSSVKLWVLDEADRMLDMGFVDDVEHIAKATSPERQTLLFSATIDKKILPISQKLQKNAHEVKAAGSSMPITNIEQRLYYVNDLKHKMQLLEHIIDNTDINQSIVFTSTKRQANELSFHLSEQGHLSEALHGDMNQRQRTRTINKVRTGHIKFLVATDVAARGIDIASLSHVINFDLPFQAEDFIHRIGRTGRAGASGTAITFTTYKEEPFMLKIHKLFGKPLEVHSIEGLEPQPKSSSKSKGPRRPFSRGPSNRPNSFKDRDFKPRVKGSESKPPFKPRFKESNDNHKKSYNSDSRPSFNKTDSRSSFNKSDSRPSFNKSDSRPSFNKSDSRPSFNKSDSRPSFNKTDSRPSFNKKYAPHSKKPVSKSF